jgi:hypothetical protein
MELETIRKHLNISHFAMLATLLQFSNNTDFVCEKCCQTSGCHSGSPSATSADV